MQFTVAFDVANSPSLGGLSSAQQANVLRVMEAAATTWSWYLTTANITVNIGVRVDANAFGGDPLVLASGGSEVYVTDGTMDGPAHVYGGVAEAKLIFGVDPNGSTFDIIMTVTPDAVNNMFYFRSDPFNGAEVVPTNKYDAMSTFQHEIGHGLGLTAFSAATTDSFFSSARTIYESFITVDGAGNPFFTGPNVQAYTLDTAGVALEKTSIAHIEESGDGDDLMSPVASPGWKYNITALDLAILADIGIELRAPTSGDDVIHAAIGSKEIYLGLGNDIAYASYAPADGRGSRLFGGAGSDTLYGNVGSDFLSGEAGSDLLIGGAGNDIYFNPDANDTIIELADGGMDAITTYGSYSLANHSNIENLFLQGAGTVSGYGNGLDNFMGSDEAQITTFYGGQGNDVYGVGSDDFVYEYDNGGFDSVIAHSNNYVLPDNVEELLPYYNTNWNGAGNGLDNRIFGNYVDNVLDGAGGNDTFYGWSGHDTLIGGSGFDTAFLRGRISVARSGLVTTVVTPEGTTTMTGVERLDFGGSEFWLLSTDSDVNQDGRADFLFQNADGRLAMSNWGIVADNPGPAWKFIGPGDFNGDGRPDALWQNDNGLVAIWQLDVSNITSSALIDNPGTSWRVTGAADFNGDGYSDILLQNFDGRLAIWNMNGTSLVSGGIVGNNPGSGWRVAATGDMNGDGKADILLQHKDGQIVSWQMDSLNRLSSVDVWTNATRFDRLIDTGDFNGDGNTDLLLQDRYGYVSVWLMSGTSVLLGGPLSVGSPEPDWRVKAAADMNWDGKTDILFQNDNGQTAVWYMDGRTRIGADLWGTPEGSGWRVANDGYVPPAFKADKIRRDFNADGRGDILWQNANGQAAIWAMNGTSLIGGGLADTTPGADWRVKGAGDFNGDGRADILWQNDNGQAAVWLMNGTSVVGASFVGSNPGMNWRAKGAGDFDGDGRSDIVWQNSSTNQIAVWVMDGLAQTGGGAINVQSASLKVVATGDINGDSVSDMVVQGADGMLEYYLMGYGTFLVGLHSLANPGPAWKVRDTGDFNGDGKADLLLQNDNGQAAIWMVEGPNSTRTLLENPGVSWKVKAAADLNGDGKSDILWQNTSGQAAGWLMNGTTMIGGGLIDSNPGASWQVIAATAA